MMQQIALKSNTQIIISNHEIISKGPILLPFFGAQYISSIIFT